MTRAFPYVLPPAEVVVAGPWSRVLGDRSDELPQELPEWDYDTILTLRRAIQMKGLDARRLAGLPEDAELDLTVRWSSSSSALRGCAWRAAVPALDEVDLLIEFDLAGDELGGMLEFATVLTLRTTAPGASPAAARRPGSILWSDRCSVMLQGDVVLFPLAMVDFAELPYPTGASWYLEVGEDLDGAALGSVLLLANERREVVARALVSASDPSEADRRVLSALRADVLRLLVERALTDEEFSEGVEYPAGTLGALLSALLKRTFPGLGLDSLRRERAHHPALFDSRVQDAADLLAGP